MTPWPADGKVSLNGDGEDEEGLQAEDNILHWEPDIGRDVQQELSGDDNQTAIEIEILRREREMLWIFQRYFHSVININ